LEVGDQFSSKNRNWSPVLLERMKVGNQFFGKEGTGDQFFSKEWKLATNSFQRRKLVTSST